MAKNGFWDYVGAVFIGIPRGLYRAVGKKAGTLCRFAEVLVEPHLSSKKWNLKKPIGPIPVASLRPWKFADKIEPEAWTDPATVILAKKRGVGVEIHVDKDGVCKKVVSMRGEKVDLKNGLPALRDLVAHEAIRGSRIFAEVIHPKGEAWVSGLLHSTKENAAITIGKHGHPQVFVLAVHKLGGHDTSKLAFDEMRGLCELVAKKLPYGNVPEMAADEPSKKALKDKIWKATEGVEEPLDDGVVSVKKDVPNRELRMGREKPTKEWDLVVMGFEESDSDKFKDKGVASLIVGDGKRVVGKVNVASEDLRVAIHQNPQRYMNKVITVVGERMSRAGAILKPRIKAEGEKPPNLDPEKYYFRWDKSPGDVKPIDPEASLKKMLEGMEPDPAKREASKTAAGGRSKPKAAAALCAR
jgi:hypothetical protein